MLIRSFLVLCGIVFAFLIASCTGDSETNNTDRNKIRLADQEEYFLPPQIDYCWLGSDYKKERFYPLGWSEDNTFAYIKEPVDEACGCYFFEIKIIDLNQNATIWKWDFNDDGKGDSLETVWQKNYNLFKKNLRKYNIVQSSYYKLEAADFSIADNDYKVHINTSTIKDSDYGFDVIDAYQIELFSSEIGIKTIYEYTEKGFPLTLSMAVGGCLISPFQNSLAIIYFEERRGYEGPPNIIEFKITGSPIKNIL